MSMFIKKAPLLAALAIGAAVVSGCSDNEFPSKRSYEVTVVNLSANQPLSPVAVVYHPEGYQAWSIGSEASLGLEMLAEEGITSEFLAEAQSSTHPWTSTADSSAIGPGGSRTLSTQLVSNDDLQLTLASMLVNTNDAFTGVTSWDLSTLEVGESLSRMLPVYDAGTEFNSEEQGTIPGPADHGEGFNSEREELNKVTRHSGVVTAGPVSDLSGSLDENTLSVLNESHRFDAPIARIVVRRMN